MCMNEGTKLDPYLISGTKLTLVLFPEEGGLKGGTQKSTGSSYIGDLPIRRRSCRSTVRTILAAVWKARPPAAQKRVSQT